MVAKVILTYSKVTALEDGSGVRIFEVFCTETGGSLPSFLKKKLAEDQADGSLHDVKHLRKKKGLDA